MVVSTTDYGTFKLHTGTATEVCGALSGKPADHIIAFNYDEDNNIYFAIQKK